MAFDDKTEDFTPGTPGTPVAADSALSVEFVDSLPKDARAPRAGAVLVARDSSESEQLYIPATISAVAAVDLQVAEKGDRIVPGPESGKGPRLRPADGTENSVPWLAPGDTNVTLVPKTKCEPTAAHVEYLRYLSRANDLFYVPGVLNIEALKEKYTCVIKTSADAAAFAKNEFNNFGDRFTKIVLPNEVQRGAEPQAGINAGFKYEPGPLTKGMLVSEVPPGSPAALAGLVVGDRVTSINGRSITNLEYDAALAQLQGPKSFTPVLEVSRGGRPYNIMVDRTVVDRPLTTRMLNADTQYLRVSDFLNKSLSDQVFQAVTGEKSAKTIVLDLRNNFGGLVDEAVEIASLFTKGDGVLLRIRERIEGTDTYRQVEHVLRGKNLVQIETDQGQQPRTVKTVLRQPYIGEGKQLVILTDHGTASAAEILSGALQDSGAATVVGTPTYGKGLGQSWLPGTAKTPEMYVTSFMYQTPKGRWPGDGSGTPGSGLKPDVTIENPPNTILGTSADAQLNISTMFLPATLLPRRAK